MRAADPVAARAGQTCIGTSATALLRNASP
jgi:hypothetical protein